uniref:MAM domain-containing protein n=1 Tax=Gasterosteus aculeatus aculeatus TaxID=481459 RepID=A0AAQ4P658_GASAC
MQADLLFPPKIDSFPEPQAAMLPFYLLTLAGEYFLLVVPSQRLPGSCNFESDTCGYTSDADLTSWSLNTDGRFVSVDAALKIAGALLSPVVEQAEWSCLRLVYQISGKGSLEVLQRTEGKSFDKPLWSSQASSDSWVISSMDLQNGTDAGSSVAIFEIHISSGYCLECDFEGSHLCGYSNWWNANVNWYVGGALTHPHWNSTASPLNPRSGHMMYVDSIYAKTFSEVATLVSPMTTVPMSGCLSFQYQRSESSSNLFVVYARDQLGQYQELWRADRETQSGAFVEWTPAQVDLKAPYSVVFEVSFNSARGGRVAVDDISFSPEFCSKDTEPTFDPSIASCDFEAGFCRYIQHQGVLSSWRRVSVKPNIFRNGDHTTGAGYFLLSHSQLSPRSGYVSRLMGPTLPGNMKYCLRFCYSLRGFNQTDQALAVYLQQQQQSSSQEKIWTQGENSRGFWITTDVTFQTSQPAKLVFVSTCRGFWECGFRVLSMSLPGHCDFEAGLCATLRTSRATTRTGHYLHMEASSMLPGQRVRLLSRPLRGSKGPQCLHFYYHMYGSGTGQLGIRLRTDGAEALLWQLSGEQSIAWLRATVEYHSDSQHQIVFEATRGSSVRSDIAIDDIILEGGPCPGKEATVSYRYFHNTLLRLKH